MFRVRLVHWNASEGAARSEELRAAGYQVEFGGEYKDWKQSPVDAYVIDLSRLPSQGRDVAAALRSARATRAVPLVFVGGLAEKAEAIRALLPDASFTEWPHIESAIQSAIAHPPATPAIPVRTVNRYAGRTLAQKLGIKENTAVLLIDPPPNYSRILGELPAGAWLEEQPDVTAPVTLCFIRGEQDLPAALENGRKRAAQSRFWICWPKGGKSGIREDQIRDAAIALNLVDYKVCSVDATWSGLLFSLKRG